MALALVVVTVVLALGIAGGFLVARSYAAPREPLPPEPDPALAHELRRITEEQRRLGEEQQRLNDEAVRRLLDTNRALLEQERLRSTSELDGKKALIDQQLSSMTSELGKVGDLV